MQKNVAYFMNKIVTNYFQCKIFYFIFVNNTQDFCIIMCRLTAILIMFISHFIFVCS